jgi:hypothetical protein
VKFLKEKSRSENYCWKSEKKNLYKLPCGEAIFSHWHHFVFAKAKQFAKRQSLIESRKIK